MATEPITKAAQSAMQPSKRRVQGVGFKDEHLTYNRNGGYYIHPSGPIAFNELNQVIGKVVDGIVVPLNSKEITSLEKTKLEYFCKHLADQDDLYQECAEIKHNHVYGERYCVVCKSYPMPFIEYIDEYSNKLLCCSCKQKCQCNCHETDDGCCCGDRYCTNNPSKS